MEFQPSADMSWQSWACNELNQAATYPSPYANVHKGDMSKLGGAIGNDVGQWKPYSNVVRNAHLNRLEEFKKSLPTNMNETTRHSKILEFMAENGLRQLGNPRIGEFAERVRPDPLHCEINAWQNLLDILYHEAIDRHLFEEFIETLSGAVGCEISDVSRSAHTSDAQTPDGVVIDDLDTGILDQSLHETAELATSSIISPESKVDLPDVQVQFPTIGIESLAKSNLTHALKKLPDRPSHRQKCGCGLAYLAKKIEEHYNNETKRYNRLPVRLIGAQAIALARFGYRLADSLEYLGESGGQKLKRIALSKSIQFLRNAGGLFNKIHISVAELSELEEFCEDFNLLVLFFPNFINITVWTVGYAIPYHARKLYKEYKVGFGILSLQAKESKHAGIKRELMLTNRSTSSSLDGKWWQIMRANYVRSFYLPEHQPSPPTYTSHFKSRTPSHCELPTYCVCGRKKEIEELSCYLCCDCFLVVDCAKQQKLLPAVIAILKPVVCPKCKKMFADADSLADHSIVHGSFNLTGQKMVSQNKSLQGQKLVPKTMSVGELKEALKERGLSVSGKKDILKRRLEGVLLEN